MWGHSSWESALRLLALSGSCSDEDMVVRSEVAGLSPGSPSTVPLGSSQTAGNCRMVRLAWWDGLGERWRVTVSTWQAVEEGAKRNEGDPGNVLQGVCVCWPIWQSGMSQVAFAAWNLSVNKYCGALWDWLMIQRDCDSPTLLSMEAECFLAASLLWGLLPIDQDHLGWAQQSAAEGPTTSPHYLTCKVRVGKKASCAPAFISLGFRMLMQCEPVSHAAPRLHTITDAIPPNHKHKQTSHLKSPLQVLCHRNIKRWKTKPNNTFLPTFSPL